MDLGEKQELFVELEQQWVEWVLSQGFKLRHGEGRILQLGPDGKGRKVKLQPGVIVLAKDLVHKDGGAHYNGIGADWNLFVDDEYISNGDHPAWIVIGNYWKSLHPLACWGGEWGDANHISLEHNGVK